jgi:hypothetical protein
LNLIENIYRLFMLISNTYQIFCINQFYCFFADLEFGLPDSVDLPYSAANSTPGINQKSQPRLNSTWGVLCEEEGTIKGGY